MDDIQKILRGASAVLAKIFTGKEVKTDIGEHIQFLEPEDFFAIAELLVDQGKFTDAEDFLFMQIGRSYTDELYNLGLHLVEKVLTFTDERLKENDYSLEEAQGWHKDWLALKNG